MNEYKKLQDKHFCERLAKMNTRTRRESEKNRHRRPVKDKPVGEISFKDLI